VKQLLLFFLLLFASSTVVAQGDGIDDEKALKRLSEVLNGESAARQHLVDLRLIAAATPYKLTVIVGASHQLLGWGWKDFESKNILRACANAAAAIGANDEGFMRITACVGRLNDAEQSTYAALSSLELEGIPAWQILAPLIGKSELQTRGLSSERLLRPRKTAEALVAGFDEKYAGAAEREARKSKPNQPVSPIGNPATRQQSAQESGQQTTQQAAQLAGQVTGGYQAEVVRVRLVPFTNPQGKVLQMLLIDWKNTGTLPIGQVNATVTFFDADGQQLDEIRNWSVFATHDQKKAIKPGQAYEALNNDGFVFMTPDGTKATTAKAVLTKVAGAPSL
jgi:hypothetical protein